MDNILIVDTDLESIMILKNGLRKYCDQFEALFALSGEEAIEVLKRESVSVLVADLSISKMGGLELLAHMTRNYPQIPCVVMTVHKYPKIEKNARRESALQCIEKPFDFNELGEIIINMLDFIDEGEFLRKKSISVSNLLQFIEAEQKTCLLEVKSGTHKKGFFYINKGVLYDAVCSNLKGEKAILEILAWEKTDMRFKKFPKTSIHKRVQKDLTSLTKEASRGKSEVVALTGGDNRKVFEDLEAVDDSDLFQFEEVLPTERNNEE